MSGAARGLALLKAIARDAATVIVLLVCIVAAVAVLFLVTYGLMWLMSLADRLLS